MSPILRVSWFMGIVDATVFGSYVHKYHMVLRDVKSGYHQQGGAQPAYANFRGPITLNPESSGNELGHEHPISRYSYIVTNRWIDRTCSLPDFLLGSTFMRHTLGILQKQLG